MGQIFISYSRRDTETVDRILGAIKDAAIDVWIDREDIGAGNAWREQIVRAIDICDAFVLMLSPNSVASDNVRKEIELADDAGRKIFVIMLEPVKQPDNIRYPLSGLQFVDIQLLGFKKAVDQIILAIKDHVAKLKPVEETKIRQTELVIQGIDPDAFDADKQEQLLDFVSKLTSASRSELKIVNISAGRVHVFVEMPEKSAFELKTLALNRDKRFNQFRITSLRLAGNKKFINISLGILTTAATLGLIQIIWISIPSLLWTVFGATIGKILTILLAVVVIVILSLSVSTVLVPSITPISIPTPTCPELDLSQVKNRSNPTILFDEAHTNGLSLSKEKARQIDPRPQMFSYAGNLAEFIRQQGYQIEAVEFELVETGSFSPTLLSNYDLLVISTGPLLLHFTTCETEAVKSFVENGGGLLILGGGTFNNRIDILLKPFGVSLTGELVSIIGNETYPENFWVTDFSGHPATGNTTRAWFNWGTNIEILDESWSELMNSPTNAWLDINNDRITDDVEPRGPFVLGAAREYGNGRIIVYGDDNVWDYYRDPNYPMYLAMIQWAIGDPARPLQ